MDGPTQESVFDHVFGLEAQQELRGGGVAFLRRLSGGEGRHGVGEMNRLLSS